VHGGTLARLPYGGEARILGPRSEIFIGIERLLQRGASCYSANWSSLPPRSRSPGATICELEP
jgi:hypothetical protein